MSPILLSELLKLPEAERLELGQELLDSIGADSDELGLTSDEIDEMHRRLAEHHADPASSIPWEEARRQLRERFGA